jgi:hypothetical protein
LVNGLGDHKWWSMTHTASIALSYHQGPLFT